MTFAKLDIPTDNLYKYGAILSTLICIACITSGAFLLNRNIDSLKNEMYRISKYTREYRNDKERNKILIKNLNILLNAERENLKVSSISLAIIIVFSLLSSIYFYRHWYQRTQKPLDELLLLRLKKEKENL